MPPEPTLVVLSGPPGSGKTSLAHTLAAAIPCPAICRDELKEGMVHAQAGEFEAAEGDPLTRRTLPLFFDVLRLLLDADVTVVAEAAFQDGLWRQGLEPLTDLARLKIVQCHTDPEVAWRRRHEVVRQSHATLADDLAEWMRWYGSFDRVSLAAPSLDVETTDGYEPGLPAIVDFVNAR